MEEENKETETAIDNIPCIINTLYVDQGNLFAHIYNQFNKDVAPVQLKHYLNTDTIRLYHDIWKYYCISLFNFITQTKNEENKRYIENVFTSNNIKFHQTEISNEIIILNQNNLINEWIETLIKNSKIKTNNNNNILHSYADKQYRKLIFDNENNIKATLHSTSRIRHNYVDNIQKEGFDKFVTRKGVSISLINDKLISDNINRTRTGIFHNLIPQVNEHEINHLVRNINSHTVNTGRLIQRNQECTFNNNNTINQLAKKHMVQKEFDNELLKDMNKIKTKQINNNELLEAKTNKLESNITENSTDIKLIKKLLLYDDNTNTNNNNRFRGRIRVNNNNNNNN
eukprot:332358_1